MTKIEKLNEMANNWYCEVEDIFAELNENGIDFYEATSEYIVASYHDEEADEDVQVMIQLGGTARTIIIVSLEEVCRG